MHRHSHSETGDMASARSSRAPSFSSDRPSAASSITFQMPTTVRPSPAYIAASVASQIVTDHHNAQLLAEDADNDELENAVFSEQALSLLNAFLDHLLFAFLSSARSPSLTAIRPAISDVLKPRLAREATEAADEELQGLLAGEDEDEFPAHHGRGSDKWDIEKVWKRTRLRIMVYTRLGELEDEDEEKYVQQERGLSMDDDDDDEAGLVSWASAIFLTSVVEYVAEQTLLVAGSAAYTRMAAKVKKLSRQMNKAQDDTFERLIIEEPDVEKIALNSALGRLWRTWRKRVRSPISPLSPGRGIRPVSSYSSLHRRRTSHDTADEAFRHEHSPIPEHQPTETEIAANIPIPVGANDVAEIEVPGLARTFEDDESVRTQTPVPRSGRPSSVLMLASPDTFRRKSRQERPMSMPALAASPFTVPTILSARPTSSGKSTSFRRQSTDAPFETPMEYAPKRTSYTDTGVAQREPAQESAGERHVAAKSPPEANAEMVAFAASTGMGFEANAVHPIKTEIKEKNEEETEIPSAGGYESEPKIMQGKRMSVGKPGPPGIVRTFSARNQRSPAPTPKAAQSAEARSYPDDRPSDEDDFEHRGIGVARTSDVQIRQTPTPPVEHEHPDKGKHTSHGSHGGYVEVQPRQTAPTSIAVQKSAAVEPKPTIPERSQRRRSIEDDQTTNDAPAVSRKQENPRASRGNSLPALTEVESSPNSISQRSMRERSTIQNGVSRSSSKHGPAYTGRETPVSYTERHGLHRINTSSSQSQRGGLEGSPSSTKAGVQRVGSTGSGKRSGSITQVHSDRDSEASQRSSGLRGRMSEEEKEREFDSLVNGEETVKFTLTPQTVRDFDFPPVQREVESAIATQPTVTAQPCVAADQDKSFGTANLPARTSSRRSKGPTPSPAARQHKSTPSRKVVTRPLAREPRIEPESMRDFADFIRSTGPSPGQEKPVQPFVNISGNGSKPTNGSSSSLGRKTSVKQHAARPLDGPTARPRMNMEPRSPAGLSTGNDDLIDFIRQGPPSANQGQPRIPRNVAPFRTTNDSDQFDSMLGGRTVESAYGSAASTLDSKASAQTINSRTGLLPEPKNVQPAYSSQPQKLSGNMASNEPVITKTRRRIKDPYAIDFSDEEEDDEVEDQLTALPPSSHPIASVTAPKTSMPTSAAAPRAAASKQESLMDFLNGMDPPSTSAPQPFMLSPEAIAAAKARANASNSTLSSSTTARNAGQLSQYGAISTTTSIDSDAPRAYKPRLQARAPAVGDARGGSRTATSELADFLKNSGPPEPSPIHATMQGKNGGGEEKKSRRFWRSKKTYGDLP